MKNLKNNIEDLRYKLFLLIERKGLTDDEVVGCSQELDKLLVQYVKINLSLEEQSINKVYFK